MRVLNKRHWPYQLSVHTAKDETSAVDDHCYWLRENLPKGSYIINYVSYNSTKIVVCFKDQQDMFMFKLAQGVK